MNNISKTGKNEEREKRINYEAVVDAYDAEERIMGWYYYLDGKIKFPFKADVIKEMKNSPLKKGEKVTVLNMSDEETCYKFRSMYVLIQFGNRELSVPLEQLYPIEFSYGSNCDKDTVESIEDWHCTSFTSHPLS